MSLYTFRQKADTYFANAVAAASKPQAFGSNNIAQNLLLCLVGWDGAGITASVNDTAGNGSWPSFSVISNGVHNLQLFYILSCVVGANTVTASFSGAGATLIQISLTEHTNPGLTIAIDQTQAPATGASTNPTSGTTSSAPQYPQELWIAYADSTSAGTWAAGSGYVLRTTAAGRRSAIEDQLGSAGGGAAPSAAFTLTTGTWMAGIAIFGPGLVPGANNKLASTVGLAISAVDGRFAEPTLTQGAGTAVVNTSGAGQIYPTGRN